MNILLVTPINRLYIVMPSLGLGYIAAQAMQRGFSVTILNCLKEKIDLFSQTGIKTTGFFMLGVPGETVADIRQTILNIFSDASWIHSYNEY